MWNGNKRAIIRGSQSFLSTTKNHKLYWLATQTVPGPSVDRRSGGRGDERIVKGDEEEDQQRQQQNVELRRIHT
jgi:hypothetical protein